MINGVAFAIAVAAATSLFSLSLSFSLSASSVVVVVRGVYPTAALPRNANNIPLSSPL